MLRIAVDIDEVLVPHLAPLAKYHKKQLPTDKKYPYVFREIFECSETESQNMIREFYHSKDFAELEPIPHAQHALWQIAQENLVYAVTGRQRYMRAPTIKWLKDHFPGVFQDIVMTERFSRWEVPKSKVCRSLGIDVIIDDNYETCMDCFNSNIDVINFIGDPVYPWCEENECHIKSWEELIRR